MWLLRVKIKAKGIPIPKRRKIRAYAGIVHRVCC